MFLQLIMDGAYPDERRALAALDAAHCVCDVAGLPAFMAWRDHVVLQDWNNRGYPAGMVAPAEETGADVWEGALTAARHALKLPPCAAMCRPGDPGSDGSGYVWYGAAARTQPVRVAACPCIGSGAVQARQAMITAIFVGGPLDGETQQLPDDQGAWFGTPLEPGGARTYQLMGRYIEGKVVSIYLFADWPLSRQATMEQLPQRFRKHFVPLEFPSLTE